jgi:hypothetical protein
MWRGIRLRAEKLGYQAGVYSANNSAKSEIANLVDAANPSYSPSRAPANNVGTL